MQNFPLKVRHDRMCSYCNDVVDYIFSDHSEILELHWTIYSNYFWHLDPFNCCWCFVRNVETGEDYTRTDVINIDTVPTNKHMLPAVKYPLKYFEWGEMPSIKILESREISNCQGLSCCETSTTGRFRYCEIFANKSQMFRLQQQQNCNMLCLTSIFGAYTKASRNWKNNVSYSCQDCIHLAK